MEEIYINTSPVVKLQDKDARGAESWKAELSGGWKAQSDRKEAIWLGKTISLESHHSLPYLSCFFPVLPANTPLLPFPNAKGP